MIWPIQSSKQELQPRLYANRISNLSLPSIFFFPPLSKKEEEKGEKNRKPFIRYNLMGNLAGCLSPPTPGA